MDKPVVYQRYEVSGAFRACIRDCYYDAREALEKAEKLFKLAEQIGCEPYQLQSDEPLQYIEEMLQRGSMCPPDKIEDNITTNDVIALLDGEEDLKKELKESLRTLYH